MKTKDKKILMNVLGILPLAFMLLLLILLIIGYASNTSNFAVVWFQLLDGLMVKDGNPLKYHIVISAALVLCLLGITIINFVYTTKFKGEK